jgi:outer membrane protein OmpA-like peptidoglycan-associated protein
MRSLIFTLLITFMATLFPSVSTAQYHDKKWAISTGVDFLDYQAPITGKFFQTDNFDLGLNVGVSRYLSGAFALSTNMTLGQGVRFPGFDWTEERPTLIDMNYMLHFKFNNGALMREQAVIAPYFVLGFGGSYVKGHPDLYVPLGGGIQFRLSSKINLRTQMVVKRSVNKDYQNLSHAIAFVYNLGPENTQPQQAPDSLGNELLITMAPEDRDDDGIIDKRDACPDQVGNIIFEGCPDRNALAMTRMENLPKDDINAGAFATALTDNKPSLIEKKMPEEIAKPEPVEEPVKEAIITPAPKKAPLVAANTPAPRTKRNGKASFLDEMMEPVSKAQNSTQPQGAFGYQDIAKEKTNLSTEKYAKDKQLNNSGLTVKTIYFDTNSDKLDLDNKAALDEVAYMLHNNSEAKLIVKGHADASGTDRYNKVLSIMRAYHVKYYLVYEQGISQTRIVSTGFGEESPISNNTTETGRSLNRRVDFQLVP